MVIQRVLLCRDFNCSIHFTKRHIIFPSFLGGSWVSVFNFSEQVSGVSHSWNGVVLLCSDGQTLGQTSRAYLHQGIGKFLVIFAAPCPVGLPNNIFIHDGYVGNRHICAICARCIRHFPGHEPRISRDQKSQLDSPQYNVRIDSNFMGGIENINIWLLLCVCCLVPMYYIVSHIVTTGV